MGVSYYLAVTEKYIEVDNYNIVFYLFSFVFLVVYVTMTVITILRQLLKSQIFTRSTFTVCTFYTSLTII